MNPAPKLRLVVLISGTGSNLKVLIDAISQHDLDIEIVHVLSNRESAPGLNHATGAGIPIRVINRDNAKPGTEDDAVAKYLHELNPDLILLSGYMRILGKGLVDQFAGKMINQHPSLLPKFKGLNTYQRALDAGENTHGASVHFVTAELDGGPIIAQATVPVERADDAVSLSRRLAPVEHSLLIEVMRLFADRRVSMMNQHARVDGSILEKPLQWQNGQLITD